MSLRAHFINLILKMKVFHECSFSMQFKIIFQVPKQTPLKSPTIFVGNISKCRYVLPCHLNRLTIHGATNQVGQLFLRIGNYR